MNLKKIINKIVEQRKLEKKFEEENIKSYSFPDYIKAKIDYFNWMNGRKFKTAKDYKIKNYRR